MTPTGAEHAQQYSTFGDSATSAARSAAFGTVFGSIDPDLATVIEAWPALPEAVRAGIVAKVREAAAGPPQPADDR